MATYKEVSIPASIANGPKAEEIGRAVAMVLSGGFFVRGEEWVYSFRNRVWADRFAARVRAIIPESANHVKVA